MALFLFLFAVYLLTYTPRINSSDGLAMFSTAESLVRRGALDIEQIRWMDLQQGTYGLDALLYSRKGIGVPVGLLPLTWLGLMVPWWGTVGVSLLFNAIVTALTAGLLLIYLQELGFGQRAGLMVALTFGLSTLAWPYAKSLFSDPFSGLLLLGAAFGLLKFRHTATASSPPRFTLFWPFLTGLCLGWNVATRYAEALFLPVYGLLLLYYLYRSTPHASHITPYVSRFTLYPLIAFVTPITFIGLGLITFNLSRYGDPFNTGYLPNETFSGSLWQGILGQLISPGRGLLLYSPIFILSLVGLPAFFRRARSEAVITLSIILIHLLLYGKWFMWHGGYAWGPRFLIPTLPFWTLFLAPVVEQAFPNNGQQSTGGGRLRLLFLVLAALGFALQLLLVVIDFAPFQNSLLDTGLPLFDPQTFFNPQYSPLVGAWSFITPKSLDLAWAWQGSFNSWLLAAIIANIILTGFNLAKQVNDSMGQNMVSGSEVQSIGRGLNRPNRFTQYFIRVIPQICVLSTLTVTTFLLVEVHRFPSQPLQQITAALNDGVRSGDAVITNDPEATLPFAELYKGRAPVLGLNNGSFPLPGDITRRLEETIAIHSQVWWLPNKLPPEQSAVELTLAANGFRARNDTFDGQRLALFAFASNLVAQTFPAKAVFENQIELVGAAYPAINSAGAALPVELRWQARVKPTEDYHVFIHLMSVNGQTAAQADGQPVLWTRPTTTWQANETIPDRYGLWLPRQTAPGWYELRVGLYRPTNGQRLRLTTGEEWVKFRVTVE